jgi:virginiamycin B lyase
MSLRKTLLFLFVPFSLVVAIAAKRPNVPIREYDIPTANSRPHDPAVGPDGALWYTGQNANKLGRLDPKTGQFKEYPLRTPGSGPHGLVADRDGNIWFTAISKGYIGRLDPDTGDIREYRAPGGRQIDPHTPVFDHQGILWFTTEESNVIGRLDPHSGEMKLKEVPTKHAIPYGIVVNSKGIPYFCEFGTNKLASIDPHTLNITEYPLPQGARPRRIALAGDDSLYYTDFARGYLGHFHPDTRKAEEWQSPGGSGSEPYGIAFSTDGIVWYSESGVKPNTLVRFDPKSKSFSVTPIPSGGGVIRNMVATKYGRLYMACSGINKVAVANIDETESLLAAPQER